MYTSWDIIYRDSDRTPQRNIVHNFLFPLMNLVSTQANLKVYEYRLDLLRILQSTPLRLPRVSSCRKRSSKFLSSCAAVQLCCSIRTHRCTHLPGTVCSSTRLQHPGIETRWVNAFNKYLSWNEIEKLHMLPDPTLNHSKLESTKKPISNDLWCEAYDYCGQVQSKLTNARV